MILSEVLDDLSQHIDKDNLADYLTDITYRLLSRPVFLTLWDQKRNHFILKSQRGFTFQETQVFESEEEIVNWFSSTCSNILWDRISDNGCNITDEGIIQALRAIKVQICLALRSDKNEIIGLLNLGAGKDGQPLSDEKLNDLEQIANQAALSIEKISTYAKMVEERVYNNLGKMAIQIAHDLNSPLNNINAFLQLLAQDNGWKCEVRPDLSGKFYSIAQRELKRAISITKDLLTYAQPVRTKTEQIAINKFMDAVLENLEELIQKSGIHVIRQYSDQEVIIPGERAQLIRLFVNLIQNAVEAMEKVEIKKLTIKTGQKGRWARITIKDTGKGIPYKIKESLFAPFVTCGKGNSLGLGLSIVERFLALHGAYIQLKTQQDQGTSFIVSLPKEKRGQNRLPVASVEVYQIPQGELLLAQDISATGLRLSCQENFSLYQLIKLFIKLPNNPSPILALGKVAWIKETFDRSDLPYEIGIEFLDISHENKERIIEWIGSREKACELQ